MFLHVLPTIKLALSRPSLSALRPGSRLTRIISLMASSSPQKSLNPFEPPPLSSADFKIYNRMAEHMECFHNHFRATWTLIYDACTKGHRPSGMCIRQFLFTGLQFCHQLEMHHGIEEAHIFPVLAKRMPAFKKELELLTQHKLIHVGLEKFEMYLESCANGERELRLDELKEVMDTFGDVLWEHLSDEVEQLGAQNMRKYWTVQEMKIMPL